MSQNTSLVFHYMAGHQKEGPLMWAWPSSRFSVVSRLVIRFNVLFIFIHQWTHKNPVFSHSLNNKSGQTQRSKFQEVHDWNTSTREDRRKEKNPAFIRQEVGGDANDEILGGRRKENTREDIRKKTKLTAKSHKHGVTKLMAWQSIIKLNRQSKALGINI